jgi:hypothetical protein
VGGLIGFLLAILIALFWDLLFTSDTRRERWRGVMRSFFSRRTKTLSIVGASSPASASGTSVPADDK